MVKDHPLKPPDLTKERSVSVHRGLSLRHCFREGHNVFIFSEVVAFRYFIEFKRKRLAVFHLLLYVLSRWYWYSYACYAVIGTVMQLLLHSGQAGEAPRWPNITAFQHMHKNLWLADMGSTRNTRQQWHCLQEPPAAVIIIFDLWHSRRWCKRSLSKRKATHQN